MNPTLFETALTALRQGQRVWLVTVAAACGSTPQRPGAMMAVTASGRLVGTIGGGALEYDCARQVAQGKARPGLRHVSLAEGAADGVGMICGGSTELLFTQVEDPQPLETALAALQARQDAIFCLPADGSQPYLSPREELRTLPTLVTGPEGRMELPLLDPRRIFVLGGGHVGRAVSRLLGQLHYRHLVVDDRPEYAARDRFPDAEEVVCTAFDHPQGLPVPTHWDAICVMTRGHQGDAAAVRWALDTQAGYIGLMGSHRKREALFADLAAAGYTDARTRIHTPIGLPIGAQTPTEIAVSICAQLISWYRQS